jgi:hypothetical protein
MIWEPSHGLYIDNAISFVLSVRINYNLFIYIYIYIYIYIEGREGGHIGYKQNNEVVGACLF